MPNFTPTDEQVRIIELVKSGQSCAVQAGAGTGKTSTQVLACEAIPDRRVQYVAFNKAVVTDVESRLPSNAKARTSHSLAFGAVGRTFAHRLNSGRMRSQDVAKALGIDPFSIPFGDGTKTLAAGWLAGHVMKAIGAFCNSADLVPARRHFAYIDGVDLPTSTGDRTYGSNDAIADYLLPFVEIAWADLSSPDGRLPYKHDHYLKTWQLSPTPTIAADVIMLDEAQDTNPVLLDVLRRQSAQLVAVGDSQQELYAWRGAENALSMIPADATAFLTHSFRFGPAIADAANSILDLIPGAELRITGSGGPSTIGPDDWPDGVLTRTNAAAIVAVLSALDDDRRPHLVGGGGEIKAFVKAAQELMERGSTTYHDLACFGSWGEVVDYAENDPQGDELRLSVKLIKDYGVEKILRAVDESAGRPEDADVVISTAHKSKGREWPSVRIGDDFPMPKDPEGTFSPAEMRLLYVAVTRARMNLDYFGCEPLEEILGPCDEEPIESDALGDVTAWVDGVESEEVGS